MDKLIITASVCGAEVTKEHNPAVPYTIEEIGREAKAAYNAGASIIHLHVREDDGAPTQCAARFNDAIAKIKELCPDVIIQPSTGGSVGMGAMERLAPLVLIPEMATLTPGTVNFGGSEIFVNSEDTVKEFAAKFEVLNVKPELEIFDKGMIDTVARLTQQGVFAPPIHFNFVMGVMGGIAATMRDFAYLQGSLPAGSTFTATGIGRAAFNVAAMSIVAGGHVRVGLEDNIYLSRGVLAASNGELVAKAVRIATELGREVAAPNEARRILGL